MKKNILIDQEKWTRLRKTALFLYLLRDNGRIEEYLLERKFSNSEKEGVF